MVLLGVHRTDIGQYPEGLGLSYSFLGIKIIIAFFHSVGIFPENQILLYSLRSRSLTLTGIFWIKINGILSELLLLLFLLCRLAS
jgi:hypothetical protein